MVVGQYVLIVYALLLLLGGLMGSRAGSKVSLVAGSASGVVLLAAFIVSWFELVVGLWIGVVVGALLAIVFGIRLSKTGKLMPSGMMLAVSLVAVLVLLLSALWNGES